MSLRPGRYDSDLQRGLRTRKWLAPGAVGGNCHALDEVPGSVLHSEDGETLVERFS
jgi:hypothetical protein